MSHLMEKYIIHSTYIYKSETSRCCHNVDLPELNGYELDFQVFLIDNAGDEYIPGPIDIRIVNKKLSISLLGESKIKVVIRTLCKI